jgi:hypothetical protein
MMPKARRRSCSREKSIQKELLKLFNDFSQNICFEFLFLDDQENEFIQWSIKNMNYANAFCLAMFLFFSSGCTSITTEEGLVDIIPGTDISIYPDNPWYFQYQGEPVLLLGGSYEDNMFQFPNGYYGHDTEGLSKGMTDWSLEQHLDELVEAGGNYLRGSLSSRNHGNRFPYLKISGTPGDNFANGDIYDLDQWDEEYWNRLDTFLQMCHDRSIIVSVEIFDRFDLNWPEALHELALNRGNRNTGWEDHPWNPDRNINYSVESSGLPSKVTDQVDDQWHHPLWYSVPALAGSEFAPEPIVLETLQRYVDRVLEHTLRFDNILYIIENETRQRLEFGDYWVDYVNKKAAEAGKTVFVTNMVFDSDPNDERQQTVRRASKYSFYEFSQNNSNSGQVHYDNIILVRNDLESGEWETGIKPVTSVKIYGGNKFPSIKEGIERFWRGIFAGLSSARFHRPGYEDYNYGIGLHELARTQIRSARMLTEEFNIFGSAPANSLLSERSDNEAYCLARPGEQYAVYFPGGGTVHLDMTGSQGDFTLRWLNIADSEWTEQTIITGGVNKVLTPPSSDPWVVLLIRQ